MKPIDHGKMRLERIRRTVEAQHEWWLSKEKWRSDETFILWCGPPPPFHRPYRGRNA